MKIKRKTFTLFFFVCTFPLSYYFICYLVNLNLPESFMLTARQRGEGGLTWRVMSPTHPYTGGDLSWPSAFKRVLLTLQCEGTVLQLGGYILVHICCDSVLESIRWIICIKPHRNFRCLNYPACGPYGQVGCTHFDIEAIPNTILLHFHIDFE